jgi:hypothetical protein
MKSKITVYRLQWGKALDDRENWFHHRDEGLSYSTALEGEEAAEECFHITNAPEECLTDEQKEILQEQNFKGPSLSVGDIVKVQPLTKPNEYFLCKSVGWEKYDGDVIELIKNLSW